MGTKLGAKPIPIQDLTTWGMAKRNQGYRFFLPLATSPAPHHHQKKKKEKKKREVKGPGPGTVGLITCSLLDYLSFFLQITVY